jgi:hypothetical protein
MSTFAKYLTESTKTYEYKVKIAGNIEKDFTTRLETACQKFEIQKLSAGKKTPIQSLPLDFPALSNESVTIYDLKTSYPVSVRELKEYLADYMKISPTHVVVRKPGEPSEEYQETIANATKSEYVNKLRDIEYKDAPKVTSADWHSTKANMSLLKELLKNRHEGRTEFAAKPKVETGISTKEDAPADSPLTKATNPHPDPKRK